MKKMRWNVLEFLIKENKYKSFVEVGVYNGETCGYLLKNIKDEDFRVFAIDPYANYSGCALEGLENIKEIAQRGPFADERCTHIEKFSADVIRDFFDRSVDLVFIDGNHKFRWVNEDIRGWWPKVRIGGILSGHDYWGAKGGRNRDVRKAVNQFIYENSLIMNRESDGVWWIKKMQS